MCPLTSAQSEDHRETSTERMEEQGWMMAGRRTKRRIRATTAHTHDITDNTNDITDNTDDIRQRQKQWKEGDGREK